MDIIATGKGTYATREPNLVHNCSKKNTQILQPHSMKTNSVTVFRWGRNWQRRVAQCIILLHTRLSRKNNVPLILTRNKCFHWKLNRVQFT